jgi:hypothetical protein
VRFLLCATLLAGSVGCASTPSDRELVDGGRETPLFLLRPDALGERWIEETLATLSLEGPSGSSSSHGFPGATVRRTIPSSLRRSHGWSDGGSAGL